MIKWPKEMAGVYCNMYFKSMSSDLSLRSALPLGKFELILFLMTRFSKNVQNCKWRMNMRILFSKEFCLIVYSDIKAFTSIIPLPFHLPIPIVGILYRQDPCLHAVEWLSSSMISNELQSLSDNQVSLQPKASRRNVCLSMNSFFQWWSVRWPS